MFRRIDLLRVSLPHWKCVRYSIHWPRVFIGAPFKVFVNLSLFKVIRYFMFGWKFPYGAHKKFLLVTSNPSTWFDGDAISKGTLTYSRQRLLSHQVCKSVFRCGICECSRKNNAKYGIPKSEYFTYLGTAPCKAIPIIFYIFGHHTNVINSALSWSWSVCRAAEKRTHRNRKRRWSITLSGVAGLTLIISLVLAMYIRTNSYGSRTDSYLTCWHSAAIFDFIRQWPVR